MQSRDGGSKGEQTPSAAQKIEGLVSVVEAVERDLAQLPKDLAGSVYAASALALAAEMDTRNSATSKSMCAKELRDTMDRLRQLAPAKKEKDKLDDLSARRAKRLAG